MNDEMKAILDQIEFVLDDDLDEDVRVATLHELAWKLVNATREARDG